MEAAARGVVTWETPSEVTRFMESEARKRYASMDIKEKTALQKGTLEEKPAKREDFLTDEELMREMTDGPIVTNVG